jgi:uncharacterized protein (TIGR02687 family)
MSNGKIQQALVNLFAKHRIVFWYDDQLEFRTEFIGLDLPNVEKIELTNNEFGVKHRVLRDQPEQKFLLYREGSEPERLDNWLLDVQLASGQTFRTDQSALWLAELELGPECYERVKQHSYFFEGAKRREALKKILEQGDNGDVLLRKMVAVCAGSEPHLDMVLEALLAELAKGDDTKAKLLERSGLSTFVWEQVRKVYGYQSSQPGAMDFVIELFKNSFETEVDASRPSSLSSEAWVFHKRWKDSRKQQEAFEALSAQCAELLQMDDKLQAVDFRALLELDYFELIDRKILSEMVRAVVARTVSAQEVELWVRLRRQSHWFDRFAHVYQAIEHGAQFLQLLDAVSFDMVSFADGVQKYAKTWFKLDQRYRKFVYHLRQSGQASLLGDLAALVENHYTNSYLVQLNDRWQTQVDDAQNWEASPALLQRDFFKQMVQPYLDRKNKVCVLISDAFRFEVGEEMATLIRQEDRYEAELLPGLSMLPSYTELAIAVNDSGDALVDGQSAKGTENRGRILAAKVPASSVVLAKDLILMGRDESRALFRDNEVVYVYHNLIDKTGDTRDTEERVFDAAEQTLDELIKLVKKLTNANATNLLVTADHGFIYQAKPLAESDFLSTTPEGAEVLYKDRRFVLGRGLKSQSSFRTFEPAQVGLSDGPEIQIPKSINRLRLQGSGSRFVHGGATLQELVIPVIRINKKRQSDIGRVEVDIVSGAGRNITTGQVAVMFYQMQATNEKLQLRKLRAGIYSLEGELLSDQQEFIFDMSSDNSRDREIPAKFILSRKADSVNNQQVELRLEEPVDGTTHFTKYKAIRYTLRRSFTSEFDF